MNLPALLNTLTLRSRTLPIVILYVTEGCNLRCCMCSYREPLPTELSLDEIKTLAGGLAHYGLRHIVYSGGEPLTRRDFPEICKVFGHFNVKQSLLTNALLLRKRLSELHGYFQEIIISLDGATAKTHNTIRGVTSFDTIIEGIQEAVRCGLAKQISIRTVIQKTNFMEIPDLVRLAKSLGVTRISFLAVDINPSSFGRHNSSDTLSSNEVILDSEELLQFDSIISNMIESHRKDFESRFISESPEKMIHLVRYFRALLGKSPFPPNSCNAPMVSAVITSTGNVEPCFFLPAVGNIRSDGFERILNSHNMIRTRKNVREYSLNRCQTCVCTLKVSPLHAYLDKF